MPQVLRILSLILLNLLTIPASFGKEWKTKDGFSVHGDFVSAKDDLISIRSRSGNLVELRRERLIESDFKFLILLEDYHSAIGLQSWPGKVPTRSEVRLAGGPNTFRTKHFQIIAGNNQRPRVARLATVMEDTLEAISIIPTGLELKPPAPSTYFQVRFMDRASFDREFGKVGMHLLVPSQQVNGAYIAAKRELWLPVGISNIDTASLIPTMVHEVCHQTMHEWLPLLPVWFLEGFAEYMASVPYEFRAFRFDKSEDGLRKTLQARFRTSPSAVNVIHPGKLTNPQIPWQNTMMEYTSSLILVYFLIHLDGSGNGDSCKDFVAEVARSKDDARGLLVDLKDIADNYNSKVANYRKQMVSYQKKIAEVNRQISSGQKVFVRSKSNSRVVIGGRPAIPKPPEPPGEIPVKEISEERLKSLNFISAINQRALIAMIGQRSLDEFATQMKQAYLKRGFIINYF